MEKVCYEFKYEIFRLHPQNSRGRQSDLIALPDRRFKESVTQKTD